MSDMSEKEKTLLKWSPSDKFKSEYDRIFNKKSYPNPTQELIENPTIDEIEIKKPKL